VTLPVNSEFKTFPVWDSPSYNVRQSLQFGKVSGNAATAKFIAYANMYLYSLQVYVDTLGTSTFSNTLSCNTIQLNVITNTNTSTNSVSLATATWGPYVAAGNQVSTTTGTALIGSLSYIALNTAAGSAGYGGYYVPQGAEIVVTLGADATAVVVPAIDYQLAPLAAVVA
jgi:hypothetical protein